MAEKRPLPVCPHCDGDGWYTARFQERTGGLVNCTHCNNDFSRPFRRNRRAPAAREG